jgi:hypothetical protein
MTPHPVLTLGQQKGHHMNDETARMMTDIPASLKTRGWRFIKSASRMSYTSPPACVAVYARRYEPGIDDERWIALTLYGLVRVTTDEANGPTWYAAREDAVTRMSEIDASRTHHEPAMKG